MFTNYTTPVLYTESDFEAFSFRRFLFGKKVIKLISVDFVVTCFKFDLTFQILFDYLVAHFEDIFDRSGNYTALFLHRNI